MHFVIYLPSGFYAAIAASVVEILQAVNEVNGSEVFTFEFVSKHAHAVSRSAISFNAGTKPAKKADVLILLTGAGAQVTPGIHLLAAEAKQAAPFIKAAQRRGAVIAATCGAPYLLAANGVLDGKRATISWWLKGVVQQQFPAVRWEPSRIIVKQGNIYTSGGGFAGLELITTLLTDLGFAKELKRVRKIMVLPPAREFQSPYEIPATDVNGSFEKQLNKILKDDLDILNLDFLSRQMGMSSRTLSRKFREELDTSPGKWIQEKRIEIVKKLLGETALSISEICYRVGYSDLASFSRLFSVTTGMTPGEFRRETGR
ncbi:GlxA family transcriptional regulator [Chitinophaga sp. 22321]|uniref:Helix-turn-helix domain-containing protein n=1 Tax=Chitinophaga hostae TaxID=2831022 RepID=A0ABS5J644_9BACT|nr:helix-turn-helix domain-containing protein [Chitinophaga hostae]MBS0030697.1 helix-turn-helix domain-containing protein [Chitinophaga hostae]